jgi:hypothetical protein
MASIAEGARLPTPNLRCTHARAPASLAETDVTDGAT